MTPQQIKQVLVRLAENDELPMDMNDLDESVFIPKMRTVREHILSLPKKIINLIPEEGWVDNDELDVNPVSAVGAVTILRPNGELFEYLESIIPFGDVSDHIIPHPPLAEPQYIWNL